MTVGTRAALEAMQAEVKKLEGELASWPELSAARRELKARLTVLEAQRADATRRADELNDQLRTMRAELDEMQSEGLRSHWWQSGLAIPAVFVGLFGAFRIASWALDRFSWPSLGDQYGLPVLLAPVAVNGARVGWALFRRWKTKRRAK